MLKNKPLRGRRREEDTRKKRLCVATKTGPPAKAPPRTETPEQNQFRKTKQQLQNSLRACKRTVDSMSTKASTIDPKYPKELISFLSERVEDLKKTVKELHSFYIVEAGKKEVSEIARTKEVSDTTSVIDGKVKELENVFSGFSGHRF